MDSSNSEVEAVNHSPKPPPIFILGVKDINGMIKSFLNIASKTPFTFKTMRNNQIRFMAKDVETYRSIVKYLHSVKLSFHTYQLKQERSYRVVLKNLHHATPIEEIKAEIESIGHKVRQVTNVLSRLNKRPLPMFFVDLEPAQNNKDIYKLKSIDSAIINVEPFKMKKDLVQCHGCQLFGHTKKYCNRSLSCVKCGENHPTIECKKAKDIAATCANCNGNHPANYKGCEIYRQILNKKRQNIIHNQKPRAKFVYTNNTNQYTTNFNLGYSARPSYADAVNNTPQST